MSIKGLIAPLTLRRRILCGVLLMLILANMSVIFYFSAELSGDSGERSEGVTREVVSVVVEDFDKMTPPEQDAVVEAYHPIVRKMAHFLEFALLGFLCGALAWALETGKYWTWWVVPAVFCLLYASSDEIHQIFTGRGPSVYDVMIDFAGSLSGLALIHLACAVVKKLRTRKKGKGVPLCRSRDTV